MNTSWGQHQLLARMAKIVGERGECIAVREPDGSLRTYDELALLAAQLRARLGASRDGSVEPVGLLLDRSAAAYASMWAAIALGRPYVPLNAAYPSSRLKEIVEQAGIRQVVTTEKGAAGAAKIGVSSEDLLIVSDVQAESVSGVDAWQAESGGEVAYLLFTSGSTGRPKGVPISYDNLWSFVQNVSAAIPYKPDDVCSQVCELSFDFSVHEIYQALLNGATLCPARTIDLFNPAQYVTRNGITVWISVPSLVRVVMANRRDDESLESIRLSIFNGEALTTGIASDWQQAAPNTVIWNNYGPTECTVAVTTQKWGGEHDLDEADVIAIGTAFEDCGTAIDSAGRIVTPDEAKDGTVGELLLSGPQRFAGYLDPTLKSPFVVDRGVTWYRTGDRVRWRDGRFFHLGRLDHQVKIGGHRIELLEIEHRLRQTLEHQELAVIAHPRQRPTELILFTTRPTATPVTANETGLATYMLPKRTVTIDMLPVNTHGKLDRGELHRLADTPA